MKNVIVLLTLVLSFNTFAKKCFDPAKYNENWNGPRITENLTEVKASEIKRESQTITGRKYKDKVYLASLTENATAETIRTACQGEGLSPIFEETRCNGEKKYYLMSSTDYDGVKSTKCIQKMESDPKLAKRTFKETNDIYPFKLTVWTFENGLDERIILFPWTTIADVIILPFSTLDVIGSVHTHISSNFAQKKIARKFAKGKDVKISQENFRYVLDSLR